MLTGKEMTCPTCQWLPLWGSWQCEALTERAIAYYPRTCGRNLKKQVDDTMREIQVAEHKTLKLTNVLSRKVEVEDMGNLAIVLTQIAHFKVTSSAGAASVEAAASVLAAGASPVEAVWLPLSELPQPASMVVIIAAVSTKLNTFFFM